MVIGEDQSSTAEAKLVLAAIQAHMRSIADHNSDEYSEALEWHRSVSRRLSGLILRDRMREWIFGGVL